MAAKDMTSPDRWQIAGHAAAALTFFHLASICLFVFVMMQTEAKDQRLRTFLALAADSVCGPITQ